MRQNCIGLNKSTAVEMQLLQLYAKCFVEVCSVLEHFHFSPITEGCPLKRVAREKWGTHDALRASRPGNEVVKAADVFGFL